MSGSFTEYVALGVNCEVAFQIRRVLKHDSSSFFSWNVTPLPALISLLRTKFSNIMEIENLSCHTDKTLINDESHGFKFHSPFDRVEFRDDPNFDEKFFDCRKKADYLVKKFLRRRSSEDRTAYFYKVDGPEEGAELQRALQEVRDLLLAIHDGSEFALVVLQACNRQDSPWGFPCIHNRYLRRLAPWNDATDGHVLSWDRVFREFPHVEPMQLAGF